MAIKMNLFPLTITALDSVRYFGEAESLTCPGIEGEVTILKGHVPLITNMKSGKITVKKSGEEPLIFQAEKGILEVSKKGVTVLL